MCYVAWHVIHPGESSTYTWKQYVFCFFGMEFLNISIKSVFPFLLFCMDGLSINVNRVLKSPTTNDLLSILPFMSVNICFMYLSASILDAYIFTVVVSSWIDPLIITQYPSLSLFRALTCIFLSMAPLTFFEFPFGGWKGIPIPSLSVSVCL